MEIVVFATKQVGLETIKCLNKKYHFDLVTTKEEKEIIEYANQKKLNVSFYEDGFVLSKNYDWLLNLWSPFILSENILKKAKHHLNIHPSLSPCCLGNDNAAWTIRNREKAGVSLLEMAKKVDEADIWLQEEVKYTYPIKGQELHKKLLDKSINIFCKNFDDILNLKIKPKKLDVNKIIKYKRADTEKDKIINPTKEIEEFINKVLAHDFAPKYTAFVYVDNKKYKVTLNLEEI